MQDDIMDYLVNPIKSKILFAIYENEQITAKQLKELHNDIPQATLYRTLNRLLKSEIIKVVAENPIRGVVEKVYAINKHSDFLDGNKILEANNGEGYAQLFANFTLSLMQQFRNYARQPDIDILHDGSGFSAIPICVSPDELTEMAKKVIDVIQPYLKNKPAPNRQMRTMAIIYTPPANNAATNKESED